MKVSSEESLNILLSGNYQLALSLLDKTMFPLELAYAYFLSGRLIDAQNAIITQDSIRCNWLRGLISLIKEGRMYSPTYFQVRNFLELDIDLLIRAQRADYLEKVLAYAPELTKINSETYKLIARVLFNNNLISLAKYYFDLYKNEVFYDPELHFMYAKYYILRKEYKEALYSINNCLHVMPKYNPALKLKSEIEKILSEK